VGNIVVVGSFVYDLIVWLAHFPRKGETQLASNFKMFTGGKGFNQAVAARRCGAQVGMIGKVGSDQFGTAFIEMLAHEGIEHSFVIQDPHTTTSLGIPMIDPSGDNSIIGIPRANTLFEVGEVRRAAEFITQHQVLLLQMEIPLEVSVEAARIAHAAGMLVILNPAPAIHSLEALLPKDSSGLPLVDWFIPNEVEAQTLSGIPVNSPDDAVQAGRILHSHGVGKGVIITLGSQGAVSVTDDQHSHVPSFPTVPIDPTGAGDAFCGAFAVAISEGKTVGEALRFANAAGALAVTVAGAEPSLPKRVEIEKLLKSRSGAEL
jgi:ribokinase